MNTCLSEVYSRNEDTSIASKMRWGTVGVPWPEFWQIRKKKMPFWHPFSTKILARMLNFGTNSGRSSKIDAVRRLLLWQVEDAVLCLIEE